MRMKLTLRGNLDHADEDEDEWELRMRTRMKMGLKLRMTMEIRTFSFSLCLVYFFVSFSDCFHLYFSLRLRVSLCRPLDAPQHDLSPDDVCFQPKQSKQLYSQK